MVSIDSVFEQRTPRLLATISYRLREDISPLAHLLQSSRAVRPCARSFEFYQIRMFTSRNVVLRRSCRPGLDTYLEFGPSRRSRAHQGPSSLLILLHSQGAGMDNNPQHYQPLSYALHPPTSTTPKPSAPAPATSTQQDEDDDGEDELVVADHLTPNDHANAAPTSQCVYTRRYRPVHVLIPMQGCPSITVPPRA